MLRAFAGDHALAQQHLGALNRALLDEVVVLHDEHFADVVGMIQKDDVIPSDFVVRDVAIFLGQVLKQKNGIGRAKLAESKPEQIALKAGREAVGRRPAHVVAWARCCGCRCHSFSVLRCGWMVGQGDRRCGKTEIRRGIFSADAAGQIH